MTITTAQGYQARDTTPPGVQAVEDYTFDALITHLHDYHGLTAADMADDEVGNGTDPAVVAQIRAMTREEAIARLPYHYFQGWDSPDNIESARMKHEDEHRDACGPAHFHPGAWVAP